MLIALPASAAGHPAASVLDLEPLLAFVHDARPDAVRLMPPTGPDDLPNGAALAAIRSRLEAEGVRAVAGDWVIGPDAPVLDDSWQTEALFAARALVAALGEAGVDPLTLVWRPAPAKDPRLEGLRIFLERLVEEAERAQVRIALWSALDEAAVGRMLRAVDSPRLGLCQEWESTPQSRRRFTPSPELLAVRLNGAELANGGSGWKVLIRDLARHQYQGLLCLEGLHSPLAYAHAAGYLRGLVQGAGSG
jgi:hypothetical protein